MTLAMNPPPADASAPPQTVLVVDDEPVARVSLAARLKRLGYRVIEAGDGKSGLDLLRRERPDLTILDWMMPELDGPTLCEQVRRDPELRSSQILLMTGHDQPEQIAEGLTRGADDFLSKAASKQEITARVQAGMRAATLVRSLERARDEIRRKQEVWERELASAARYVESLLPAAGAVLPGVQLVHAYRPSLALGGDLFNVVPWGLQLFGLYMLDASGHGVSPALRSASVSTFLRGDSLLHQVGSDDPGAILTEANRQFPITEDGDYFTILFVRVDLRAHSLSYAAAGHGGGLLHHRNGDLTWLKEPGLPLGFGPDTAYRSVHLPVRPGDRLFLFSDGLYEVPNPGGELWGPARLEETIRALRQEPLADVVPRVIDQAVRWQGHAHFPDDVALMGVAINA
ncbi:PP2C family protein-serine/threonine phosphatase [Nitrospira moscoviensis]|uniref:Putative Response regulator receiver modulated Serine phosphatase n=1 Tax=Nitrospira moscoviensis TaxID=42253 RepID=A0A0K2GC68_NITMO|nr:SpoIIE family protein phosphatase [Nitrospira moscoviensis]ALA58543.1 putative Response regulator receiver modulated Serine phosphatase [Nitrospira moscoviensis]